MDGTTGAAALARALACAGVRAAFMMEYPELAELRGALEGGGSIKVVSPVSELCATPMADGYARASGLPALAVTLGGGHLMNQAVGLASAWADKSPVILLGVEDGPDPPPSPIFDRERADLPSCFDAITRRRLGIERPADIPATIFRAAAEAVSSHGGPVVVTVRRSLLTEPAGLGAVGEKWIETGRLPGQIEGPPEPDPGLARAAADLLARAKKPLIVAGGGAIRSGADRVIDELARSMVIPVVTTMGGMGAADPDSPMYVGPSSYLSGEAYHTAIKEADVVLSVGCCFSGLDGFGLPPLWSPSIKHIQINIDPVDIGLNPPAEIAIVADGMKTVRAIRDAEAVPANKPARRDWVMKLRDLNRAHLERVRDEAGRPWKLIHPASVMFALQEVAGDSEARVVLDGGNTALWAGMLVPVPGPRRGFFPMGMGTLGLGLPGAIGVKLACPDKPVFIVTGDGAFLYNIQELETMARHKLPIVIVIVNDSAWNMIRAGQAMAGKVHGTDLPSQNYAEVARAHGFKGARIADKEDIGPAFKEAVDSGEPWVLDVVTDPDSLPDSLVSFARVEFAGASMPPSRLPRALREGNLSLDIRGLNLARFIKKTV